jgi:signal transduction histidine kinase
VSQTRTARPHTAARERRRLADANARRLSLLLLALCLTLYAGAIAFELVNPRPSSSSWGSANLAVGIAFTLATLCFPVVGHLITQREAHNPIGWLMLLTGLIWSWQGFSDAYVVYGARTEPGSLPDPALIGALSSWTWVPAIGVMGTFLILLFPNGRLPSPRWLVVAWVSGIAMVVGSVSLLFRPGALEDVSVSGLPNPLGIEALEGVLAALSASLVLLPLCSLACAVALVLRFRRARGTERLQLKWFATAGAVVALLYLVAMAATLGPGNREPVPGWVVTLQDASLLSFGVIPLAIGVAILRHRLYGIDVVINKAVVFGTLASFITAVYVAIVVGIGSLVGRGERPNLALSVVATAIVAVAFQPVRDTVQRFANRLVYGARATPYEVLSDFADRMGGTYDAAELLPVMARTVAHGIGATRVDVWLRLGSTFAREASWPVPVGDTATAGSASVDEMVNLEGDRVVAVRHHDELLGAITVVKPPGEAVTPAEGKLLDDVAAQAGLVLRNVRLIEELRTSRQRLVTTQDEQRRRLERNLHDGAQQNLVSVALMLRTARARWGNDDAIGTALDSASEQLRQAIDELRELARGLHPAILTDRGLGPAIQALAERSPVPVVVDYQLTDRQEIKVEATLYFVVAEALTNVAKYAQASEATVTVAQSDGCVILSVTDDGVGGADRTRGSGLRGLADRVAVVDGALDVASPAGRGTRLTCRIPLTRAARQPASAPVDDLTVTPQGAGQ